MPIGQITGNAGKERKLTMKNVISLESRETIVALHKAGFTQQKISEITKVKPTSVQRYVDIYRKDNPEFIPQKKLERIEAEKKLCALYKSGIKNQRELAEKTGIPRGSVPYVLGVYGISNNAKTARRNSGEIPEELMKPVLDWLANHAAADVAEKMADFAKSLTA